MKTKYWILLLAVVAIVCTAMSIPMLTGEHEAAYAEIISNGKTVTTVSLNQNQTFSVLTPEGSNLVTVEDGRIGVTQASCPDHYCISRGMCSGGAQIVCLHNKLVIRFLDPQAVDSVVG